MSLHNNNYSVFAPYNISHLNLVSLDPSPVELTQEELAAELELWGNKQFTFDVPPGMGLLDDDFDVSPEVAKLKNDVVNNNVVGVNASAGVPGTATAGFQEFELLPHLPQVFSPSVPQYFTFTTTNPVVTAHLQSLDYPFYPAPIPPSSTPTRTGNQMILPKQPSPITTEQKIAPAPPITTSTSTNRKNSGITKSSSQRHDKKVVVAASDSPRSNSNNNDASSKSSSKSSKSAKSSIKSDDDNKDEEKVDTKITASATNTTSAASSVDKKDDNTEENNKTNDPESAAKIAAEEDKRRRNTAASARFRIKKKMREQALEHTAKEMTAKAEMLEGRVKELELEVKWLRSLIVEKDARLLDIQRPEKRRRLDPS
ncbi:3575_t:CDS:2 [Ambispora gerdemannii]|uniref:3575_t:CDS:1 n=1 Tax=Ambispora gerdemannii TaxID=144530 RepID=A0A9N9FI11_9GLOM|nr:3575_t:CDS:2 [Ambispora gerdemannii]